MSDFRKELYNYYVSTFKQAGDQMDEAVLKSHWAWCESKYLPLLKKLDRNEPILELGCGPGNMMEFLKKHGFSHTEGIDISKEQVGIAIKRGLDVKLADVFEFLNSKQGAYSAIIAIDFIEHFAKQELIELFAIIHRALKENGALIIQTPNGDGLFSNQVIYGDLSHLTVFNIHSLGQILRLSGFAEIKFYESGPAPVNIVGVIRVILWKLIKLFAEAIRMVETGKVQEVWTENIICCCRKH